MEQYAINRQVLLFSRISLLLWMMSVFFLIILLIVGNPYWFFPFPGLVFLYLWIMLASLYPGGLEIGEEGIGVSLAAGPGRVRMVNFADLAVEEKKDYFELTATGRGKLRKYLVSKKALPRELEQHLRRLAGGEAV